MVTPVLAVVMAAKAIQAPAVANRLHWQSREERNYYQTKITHANLSFETKGQSQIVFDLLRAAKAR